MSLPDGARESDTERDGFLSYAGEWHALAIGAAVGFAVVTTGDVQLAAMLISVALGLDRARNRFSKSVTFNVRREPWYAIGGLAAGGIFGLSFRLLSGGTVPEVVRVVGLG